MFMAVPRRMGSGTPSSIHHPAQAGPSKVEYVLGAVAILMEDEDEV